MMTFLRYAPSEQLDHVMTPVEGLEIEVSDECKGCGSCIETCGFRAITLKNGKAVHSDICRKCGRCERTCPNDAVKIKLHNKNAEKNVADRILEYINVN